MATDTEHPAGRKLPHSGNVIVLRHPFSGQCTAYNKLTQDSADLCGVIDVCIAALIKTALMSLGALQTSSFQSGLRLGRSCRSEAVQTTL